MLGFKGKDGAFDENAFRAHASALGYRPVVLDSADIAENNKQAAQIIKDNPGAKVGSVRFQ